MIPLEPYTPPDVPDSVIIRQAPIYYDDLTDAEKSGTVFICYKTTEALADGAEFTLTVTPTEDWYTEMDNEHSENAGDPISVEVLAHDGAIETQEGYISAGAADDDPYFGYKIMIFGENPQ